MSAVEFSDPAATETSAAPAATSRSTPSAGSDVRVDEQCRRAGGEPEPVEDLRVSSAEWDEPYPGAFEQLESRAL